MRNEVLKFIALTLAPIFILAIISVVWLEMSGPPEFLSLIQSQRGLVNKLEFVVALFVLVSIIAVILPTIGIIEQVRKKELAEENLYRSEQNFKNISENFKGVLWIISADGEKMIYVSPQYESIWGKSCESLYQEPKSWIAPIHPSDREKVINSYSKNNLIKSGFDLEYRIVREDGEVRWIWDRGFPVKDLNGQVARIVRAAEDITERKAKELEILKLSKAVEQSLSSILITDRKGIIEYANPMFQKVSGYTAEELLGQTPRLLKSENHSPEFYKKLWETILSGHEWRGSICNKRKSGDLYWDFQSITPIKNDEGEITHFLSVSLDDTERKHAEEKLKIYARELQRSNQELDDFANIAAHDLQEPLRKIIVFGDRLQEISPDEITKQHTYIDRMRASALRMKSLLEDLLSYSRVTTKKKSYESVNLKNIIDEIMEDLQIKFNEVKGSMNVEPLPRFEADPVQMRQLFQNLILNALKYKKEDVAPVINISGSVKDGICKVRVRDNGIGLNEKYSARIFQPFQRLHGRTAYEGTGMGLAICQKIMLRHYGEINVESSPGAGATFIITLPEKRPAFQPKASQN